MSGIHVELKHCEGIRLFRDVRIPIYFETISSLKAVTDTLVICPSPCPGIQMSLSMFFPGLRLSHTNRFLVCIFLSRY